MNTILFDTLDRKNLYPLTKIRPVSEIRVGILTIKEKWEIFLKEKSSYLTTSFLSHKYFTVTDDENLFINSALFPYKEIVSTINSIENNSALFFNNQIIAFKLSRKNLIYYERELKSLSFDFLKNNPSIVVLRCTIPDNAIIASLSDIILLNEKEINSDFCLITDNKNSQPLHETNLLIGDRKNLFIEEGAIITGSTINVINGKVFIGKNSQVLENSVIKGTVAICDHAIVEPCARISNGTTVGKYCKVGGEISNTVFLGYSNKAHDGFIGNSIIGEWCNIGAGTNFSNLKNNYGIVRQWHYPSSSFKSTGLRFCGIVMGDYSKCSISSAFNTGSVVGICCNLFGEGFHERFVKDFSFGGKASGYSTNIVEKIIETAEIVCKRRDIILTDNDKTIILYWATMHSIQD